MSAVERFSFLFRREAFLLVFVAVAFAMGISDGIDGQGWGFGLLTIAVYTTLAWFTHQRRHIPTLMTILVLILTGSGYLYDSFTSLTMSADPNILLMIFKGTVGVYLTWGALIIHREHRIRD
ncbi:hypothetical protein [Pseudodesulfovibrio sp. zrk46]|uniref:hypothetical protein n=1 Tax=Pseudodesulfovibrio sp. zrk46 TaxID=2725288 RepID=UPI001449A56A|nr:hypothetical protein [Pseudodesulfovibrio sp. zrk46]QJB55810.1 hypothetical protein HFN16_05050 [Pseudodesulfovibrio sp. zrk46]